MPGIPECLQRRFKVLDELIEELGDMPRNSQPQYTDPSVKLMCNFWSILKDDPECNLSEEVQQYFKPVSIRSSVDSTRPKSSFYSPILQCYLAKEEQKTGGSCGGPPSGPPGGPSGGPPGGPSGGPSGGPPLDPPNTPSAPPPVAHHQDQDTGAGLPPAAPGGPHEAPVRKQNPGAENPPLNKVLTNLKNAASFDNKCEVKLKELLAAEKYLKSQITRLEQKEKEGANLMKEADNMWLGMENSYKEKIAESSERQHDLMKQLQDIDKSAAKWRKNRRDLEAQLQSLNKCQLGMVDKINQKTNDLKSIDNEMNAYKRRIENTKKEAEAIKSAIANKKKASDGRLANIAKETAILEKTLQEESKRKKDLDETGRKSVFEARTDLQKICKTLLQRRLEEEDLTAEKRALEEEIDTLKETCDNCKERCAKKQQEIADEIKKTDLEIANWVLKCTKCSQCVDSRDVRTLCIDCPRCQEYRECLVEDDECRADPAEECVCSKVKKIFLNNVFENMSTVLEKKVKTNAGRALGGEILRCLKKSTNAKLNDRTRRLLQEFVLQTVKKNLNLTIVGGACKTRCELDKDTYQQLMLCLKQVKPTPPPKADKGTNVKKEPCKRWGGHTECHCPKGPEKCICTRKAPPPVSDPATCPPEPPKDPAEKIVCPHNEGAPCGPDCGAHDTFDMDRVGADVSEFRPEACSTEQCPFGKNMRAAQCVLGPESLKSPHKTKLSKKLPNLSILDDQIECKCGKLLVKPCSCGRDAKQLMSDKPKACQKYSALKSIDVKSQPIKCTLSGERPWNKYRKKDESEICPLYKPMKTVTIDKGGSKVEDHSFVARNMEKSDVFTDGEEDHSFVKHSDDTFKLVGSIMQPDDYWNLIDTDSEDMNKYVAPPNYVLKTVDEISEPSMNDANINPFLVQTDFEIDSYHSKSSKDIKSYNASRQIDSEDEDIYLYEVPLKNNANIVDNYNNPLVPYQYSNQTPFLVITDSFERIENMKINEKSICAKCKKPTKDRLKSVDQYKNELQLFYDNEKYGMSIEFIAENGVSKKLDTFIKKTSSGNVALDVSNIDRIGEISSLKTERPVLLRKSASGNYKLFMGYQSDEDNKAPNAVLRRTQSNSLLVVVTEPIINYITKDLKPGMRNNEMYKVKLRGTSRNEKIPPAILRSSSSYNYLIVLDKEFEKKYTNSLNSAFDEHGECFVELQKNNSIISVNFDKNSKKNAVLVKTPSDSIKILVNGPVFEQMSKKVSNNDRSSKQFADLIRKMPSACRNYPDYKTKTPTISNVKSSSDSNLYRSAIMKNCLLTGTSAKFQRTESGEYAAILDKETKNSLVNNLQTHLTHSSQNRVPIKISESGEVTIILNQDDNEQLHFASLKITRSGNVYVVVDENVLKYMEEKEKKYSLQLGSEHMIGKVIHPENKSTTTSCTSRIKECVCKPDEYVCDHQKVYSKKVSKTGFQSDTLGKLKCGYDLIPEPVRICKKKDCDSELCTAECCTSYEDKEPENCCLGKYKTEDFDSYYFSESLYRYEDKCLSKDILEITSLCKKLINDISPMSSSSRSSLKSVSFGSNSSSEWNLPNVLLHHDYHVITSKDNIFTP